LDSLKKQLSKEEHISKPSTVYNTTFRKKDTWRRVCNTNCERIANIERGLKKMAEMDMKVQPRTQALSTTRLAGGKTLVQAGHVSPRFWEITKFLHKGGGLSFILPT
jgi:hypothetical protein